MNKKTPLSQMTRNLKRLRSFAFLFIILVPTLRANAQFFDRLSNPTISITLTHPPGLGLKINKIAFGHSWGNCSDQIIDMMISDLVGSQIDVINRSSLESILSRGNFRLGGYVDKQSAAQINKLVGPCALVFVKVQRCSTQQDRSFLKEKRRDPKTKEEYIETAYFSKTRAFLKATIQTVDLATGRIFSAQMFEYSPELVNKSYQGYPEAPAAYDAQDVAFKMLVADAHRMFLPWNEQTTLNFYDDKEYNLKQAYQSLKSGDIDQAFELSKKNVESCQQAGVKDKIMGRALYNLGMCYMIRNDYELALQNFRESEKFRPGGIVSEAIAKCLKARSLMSTMQQIEERASIEADQNQINDDPAPQVDQSQAPQVDPNALKNTDVIEMTKNKISAAIIMQKIKNSKCDFDTSPAALNALTKAGVNEKVIMLMMDLK